MIKEASLALREFDFNKLHEPDGINTARLKHCWHILKMSFMNTIYNFHQTGILPHGINSSFIALIPKTTQPRTPFEYRPISLINSVMKILLMILANRLKQTLTYIILEELTGFMKDRNISDMIIITSEIIHSKKHKKYKESYSS